MNEINFFRFDFNGIMLKFFFNSIQEYRKILIELILEIWKMNDPEFWLMLVFTNVD